MLRMYVSTMAAIALILASLVVADGGTFWP